MNVSTFIALRYMNSSRKNLFFSWITAFSVTGIAIGVAAMIVVLSVINGFEHELRSRFLAANAHILAYRFPAGMSAPDKWSARIKKDFPGEIRGTTPFVNYETMVRKSSLMASALVRGITPAAREKVQSLRAIVRPESALTTLDREIASARRGEPLPRRPAVILGSGLMTILGVKIGDEVDLVSPAEDSFGSMRPFTVVGVYDSGLNYFDNKIALMSLTTAQAHFKMGNLVTGLEIGLESPNDSIGIMTRMGEKYSLSFWEWQSANRPMFEAMKIERAVIGLIVALVAFVAGFNILTTLFVSVSQKQRDICVLKSLGARNGQVLQLFLKQGLLIGVVGSTGGVTLAWLISTALKRYEFIKLPEVYMLSSLPVDFDWHVYATMAGAGLVISVIAGVYPALVATRLNPIEGVRGNAPHD